MKATRTYRHTWHTHSEKQSGQFLLEKNSNAIQGIKPLETIHQQVPGIDIRGWKIQHVTVHDPVHKGHEHICLTLTSSANSTPSFPGKREVCFLPDINMHILTHTHRLCSKWQVIAGWKEPDLGKPSMTLNRSVCCGKSVRWKMALEGFFWSVQINLATHNQDVHYWERTDVF